jgi:dihydroxyacetone kinase-like protein
MTTGLTTESLCRGLRRISVKVQESADELNSLDGKLGDGDIGVTMSNGMKLVSASLDDLPADVGMALFKCAQAFSSVSGSSFSTLLATGLMSAAKECKGRIEVPWGETADLLGGAIEKMASRGRSELGEKTVLDALEAVRQAAVAKDDPAEILAAADAAVAQTLETFLQKPNKQGRARMFGEKSIGQHDPGMVVIKRILDGLKADS